MVCQIRLVRHGLSDKIGLYIVCRIRLVKHGFKIGLNMVSDIRALVRWRAPLWPCSHVHVKPDELVRIN